MRIPIRFTAAFARVFWAFVIHRAFVIPVIIPVILIRIFRIFQVLFIVSIFIVSIPQVSAEQGVVGWDMFQNDPAHTGYSQSKVPQRVVTLWSYQTGLPIVSSPSVSGGMVFVGSMDGSLYCMNESTGVLLWSYKTGAGVVSSPAISGGRVFAGSLDGNIYALDAKTGKLLWKYQTGVMLQGSPVVSKGRVFLGFGDKLSAFRESSGEIIWYHTIDTSPIVDSHPGSGSNDVSTPSVSTPSHSVLSGIISSPAVSGGRVFVGSGDGTVYAFLESTGNLIWKSKNGSKESRMFSSPSVSDGIVFVGLWDIGRQVYALNSSTGNEIWSMNLGDSVIDHSSPAIAGGRVIVCSLDGYVYSLDMYTGRQVWGYNPGKYILDSSPVVADGKVIISYGTDGIHCLNESTGNLIWKYAVGSSQTPSYTGGSSQTPSYIEGTSQTSSYVAGTRPASSPAISNERIFVGGSDGRVYSLGRPVMVPVSISSTPSNASVFIDEKFYGTTPLYVNISMELHKIKLMLTGYVEWIRDISAGELNGAYEPGEKESIFIISANLKKLIAQIMLDIFISSTPPGADIYIDNKYMGITPTDIWNVSEGYHTIIIQKTGLTRWEKKIYVSSDMTVIDAILQNISGSVSVSSEPAKADIYIDKEYMGITPALLDDISPGYHSLKIKKSGHKEWKKIILVRSHKTTSVSVSLQEQKQENYIENMLISVILLLIIMSVFFIIYKKWKRSIE